jgi:hypothetical protein
VEELRKLLAETKVFSISEVRAEAAKYNMLLLEMTNFRAVVGFEMKDGFRYMLSLKGEADLSDAMAKAHMHLTIQYRDNNRVIPSVPLMPVTAVSLPPTKKGGCCGGSKT